MPHAKEKNLNIFISLRSLMQPRYDFFTVARLRECRENGMLCYLKILYGDWYGLGSLGIRCWLQNKISFYRMSNMQTLALKVTRLEPF